MAQTDVMQNSQDRIRRLSSHQANVRIDANMRTRVEDTISKGPGAIQHRLQELDREWDIDRVLMLNFSVLVFAQLLAARKNRNWLWGPLLQTPLLFMHATLGWCPPSLWFRPMGFRTRFEIQAERDVLLSALWKLSPSQTPS
ncbi:MAG: hypothetical protein ACK5Y2_13840 [Bdellovibrionales bacterium]